MKELHGKAMVVAPKKKPKKRLKDVFDMKNTHKMPDGTIMSGKKHSKSSKVVRKAPARSKLVGSNRKGKRRGY